VALEVVAPRCKSNGGIGLALVTIDNANVLGGQYELNGQDGVVFFGARYCSVTGPKCRNNSQSGNNIGNEISIESDGTTVPIGNSVVNPSVRITGVVKSGYGILEVTGGPNTVIGGAVDAGNFGTIVLVNQLSKNVGVANVRDSEDPQTVVTNAGYTATADDYYIRYTSGGSDRVLLLPDPTGLRRSYVVLKVDNGVGAVLIGSLGVAKSINGLPSYSLTTQYQSVLLVSNGSQWEAM
jgi:hypothetical protein